MPPELAAASSLQFLDLSYNPGLALEPAGADLLAALPALEQARLGPQTAASGTLQGAKALLRLVQRAPHLGLAIAASDSDSEEEVSDEDGGAEE